MQILRPLASLTALFVLCSISCGALQAQGAAETRLEETDATFAQEMQALGENESCTVRSLGKTVVTLHPSDLNHALKEVDRAAMAVAETPEQVVEVLRYALQ